MDINTPHPSGTKPNFLFPGMETRFPRTAAWLLAVLVALHGIASWGHISFFWGDPGAWCHQVERMAQGQVPYVDFFWAYPPLAIWILGTMAKVLGTHYAALQTGTTLIYCLVFAFWFGYLWCVVRPRLALLAVSSGFVLTVATSQISSAPISAGMYIPAAPIGVLFLLGAVVSTLWLLSARAEAFAAMGVAVCCACCILTKHDFWLPALYLVAVDSAVLWLQGRRLAVTLVAVFTAVVLAGNALVARSAGWQAVLGTIHGFGNVAEQGFRGAPTLERLTIDIASAATLIALIAVCVLVNGAISSATGRRILLGSAVVAIFCLGIHVFMTYRIGLSVRAGQMGAPPTQTEAFLAPAANEDRALALNSLAFFVRRWLAMILPVCLPPLLAGAVLLRWSRWKAVPLRNTVILLAGLCTALRLRRFYEHVEWYHILFEIPLYLLFMELCLDSPANRERLRRSMAMFLAALILIGAFVYRRTAVGPFTRQPLERVQTRKGSVWLTHEEAEDYRQLDAALQQVDPGGRRPLFAYGYSSGFNYFLDRKNPTPLIYGFRFSHVDRESVIADVLRHDPPALLLDNNFYFNVGMPRFGSSLLRWELEMTTPFHVAFDRPYFERLLHRCALVMQVPRKREIRYTLYSCGSGSSELNAP
jgi:hypothetical protein